MKSFGVFLIILGVSTAAWVPSRPKDCYTVWFNRDGPTGFGDYETLAELRMEYPGAICIKPLSIEAKTLSDVPASNTGQDFQYCDVVHGFACVNSQQKAGKCLNYKVRFGCPCVLPPRIQSIVL